jgi:hypothetical protein
MRGRDDARVPRNGAERRHQRTHCLATPGPVPSENSIHTEIGGWIG